MREQLKTSISLHPIRDRLVRYGAVLGLGVALGAGIDQAVFNNQKPEEQKNVPVIKGISSEDENVSDANYALDVKQQVEAIFKEKGFLGEYPIDTIVLSTEPIVASGTSWAALNLDVTWGKPIDEETLDVNLSRMIHSDDNTMTYIKDEDRVKGGFNSSFPLELVKFELIPDDQMPSISFSLPDERFKLSPGFYGTIADNDFQKNLVDSSISELIFGYYNSLEADRDNMYKWLSEMKRDGGFGIFHPDITVKVSEYVYKSVFDDVDTNKIFKDISFEPKDWELVDNKPMVNNFSNEKLANLKKLQNDLSKEREVDFNEVSYFILDSNFPKIKDLKFVKKEINGEEKKFARVTWYGIYYDPFEVHTDFNEEYSDRTTTADIPYEKIDFTFDGYDPLLEDSPVLNVDYTHENYDQIHGQESQIYLQKTVQTGDASEFFLNPYLLIKIHFDPTTAEKFGFAAK